MTTEPKHLELSGERLFVCDMRPGFSEDGVTVSVPKGSYGLTVVETAGGEFASFSLVLAGEAPDGHVDAGTVSVDMARLGVFDPDAFLEAFADDREALFDWSDDATDGTTATSGATITHESGLQALVVDLGSDGVCDVHVLLREDRAVGLRVSFRGPAQQPVPTDRKLRYTSVEVTCRGIDDLWTFVDDWNFEPDADDILDDIVSEVSMGDQGDPIDFGDSDQVDADAPIAAFRRRFRGVGKFSVFVEQDGDERRPVSIADSLPLPECTSETTSRELASILHAIFVEVRQQREG